MDTEQILKEFDALEDLEVSGYKHEDNKLAISCIYKARRNKAFSMSTILATVSRLNGGKDSLYLADISFLPMAIENIRTETPCWITPNLYVKIILKSKVQTTKVQQLTKKQQVLAKTNGHCAYCGIKLTEETMTIDRIVPKAQGGTKALDNSFAACNRCNGLKSKKNIKQFRPILAKELGQTNIEFYFEQI